MGKVIDLFSGVGGLSIGFSKSGFDIVYANEFDTEIAESFQYNHQNTLVDKRDINGIDIRKTFSNYIGKIDVVMGGPPCQGFSQKGNRLGLNDDRNFLFRRFLEIVDYVSPKVFLIENVPNILTSKNGYFIDQIKLHFLSSPYEIYSQTLNAYEYGIPQKRRRAFIVGSQTGKQFKFPSSDTEYVSVEDAISDLPHLKSGEGKDFFPYHQKPSSLYQKTMRSNSQGIFNHQATSHSVSALNKLKLIPPLGGKKNLPAHMLTKSIYSGTWERINPQGPSRTITTRFDTPSSGQFTLNDQDRCLTVREAARLQSFPDKIIFKGNKSSQMKQVGNAVPPLLAEKLSKSVIKLI